MNPPQAVRFHERRVRTGRAMFKRTAIAILLGLCGFALGIALARVTDEEGPVAAAEAPPPALRHSSQLRPPPESSPAPRKAAVEAPRSSR